MRYKRGLCAITASIFLCTFGMGSKLAYGKASSTTVYDSEIGRGITYTQKVINDASIKKLLNIVTCDLNDSGSNIVFSKAKDIEKKNEVLTKQVKREIFKGNNVIAGINADMFDMGLGFSSGAQIRDGAVITNHNGKYEEDIYPVFGIDKDKRAFISYIHMDAKLTVSSTSGSGATSGGAINLDTSITIDSINREKFKDKLVLNDSQLNEKGKVDFSAYAANGAVTVVKGINEPIKLGKEYEGTIESVGFGSKGSVIPKDGVLLCSNGTKAEWIKAHLKPGDKIKIQVNYDRGNIAQAIGAYTYFLRNGRVLSNDEMVKAGAKVGIVQAREARTAIGITADNKVIAITVDAGKPSTGISNGATLLEMANLLKSLGAVDGVGMDGGGSTQMNAKLYGESNINIITKPSDGRERALTNGILFVSNNESTYEVENILIPEDITIYKNTSYKFRATGFDTNFNPLNLSDVAINWYSDSSICKIDSSGLLTSGNIAGSGMVTAQLGRASATTKVRVVDAVASISISDNKIVPLQTGINRQFTLSAKDSSGNPIIIDNSAAIWGVSNGIGQIDKNGFLKVVAKSGNGVVTAKVGNKSISAKVGIMQNSEVIDDFEHNDITRYSVNGNIGGTGSISKEYAKSGLYSYKIRYNYDKTWDKKSNGIINLMPTYTDKMGSDMTAYYTSSLMPKRLGMWIYGDGHAPLLRADMINGEGNKITIDIVKKVDFIGWKYVDVDIPKDAPYPITLSSIYFVETNKNLHLSGDIYFDDIKFVYSDAEDTKSPTFSNFIPSGMVYSGKAGIKVTIYDKSGIDSKSILSSLDGKSVTSKFDENSGILSYDANNLSKGVHTYEVKAADRLGNNCNPAFKGKFTVTDVIDNKPPVISGLQPSHNSVIKIQRPRVSVKIKDAGVGIDTNDINISLDGIKLITYYDEPTGWASAVPNDVLSIGTHKISVNAKDRSGNKVALQTISFKVAPMVQPRDPNNFKISILSDSHGTEFGNVFFNEALKNDSELVIQNGDMVDSNSAGQWTEGLRQLALVKNKPVMNSPGDREVSNGNISNFIKYLGMPTYSFEFGNSLFVSLNSSIGQSISASDPTQFDYLQRVLADNKKENVFIYTHVPTKDSSGLNHALPVADTQKLETILSSYKKQNANKNINVIFGHVHAFQSWVVGGVNYTIDGNECLKNYISTDKGGFMGYTSFSVNDSKVSRKFIPIAQSIAVIDNSIVAGEMKVVNGTRKKLNLYGDFNISSADYIAQINNIKDVDIRWESDNPTVVTVSEDGVITANSIGTANIKASTMDKTYTFRVISRQQLDGDMGGFKITANSMAAVPGQNIKINGIGYDIYGNSLVVNNDLIKWQITKGTVINGVYTVPKEITSGEMIEIVAQCKGFTSKVNIKVSKTAIVKQYAKITTASLNIRDNPSSTANIIGNLKLGDIVEVLGEENGWIRLNFNENKGYISKAYTVETRSN